MLTSMFFFSFIFAIKKLNILWVRDSDWLGSNNLQLHRKSSHRRTKHVKMQFWISSSFSPQTITQRNLVVPSEIQKLLSIAHFYYYMINKCHSLHLISLLTYKLLQLFFFLSTSHHDVTHPLPPHPLFLRDKMVGQINVFVFLGGVVVSHYTVQRLLVFGMCVYFASLSHQTLWPLLIPYSILERKFVV